MKEFLKNITEKIIPIRYQLHLRHFYLRINNKLDKEMFFVYKFLEKKRRFLDVGANVGIYSFHFRNIFTNIDAFEPLRDISYRLSAIQNDLLKVHNIGISNCRGELQLFIPYYNGNKAPAWASLEKRKGKCELRTITVKTIDDYNFQDVDLIKIDVEGHEESVIAGAHKTIKKTMPILIVEIEQRHIEKEINKVFLSILNLNYDGFFIDSGNLVSIDQFSYHKHQKPFLEDVNNKKYVNNFIFLPNNSVNQTLI
tara:strand:- start:357 stop:1118 length:762 start_codon:yes stop_codon:yes gene_type:complete